MSLDQISFTLGQIDSKLADIVKTQNDISVNGCHLGREHSRQINDLQKRNGVRPENGASIKSKWFSVSGMRATDVIYALLILALIIMVSVQSRKASSPNGQYVSRHELQRELDAFAAAKNKAVSAAEKVERSAR